MAFVAVVPAVGSAVAAGVGAVGAGLGAAASGIGGALASGAGAIGSGLGALGGAVSSIPVIGSTLGGAIGGLGSGIGALGSGLGGSIGALGAGNLGGAVSSLGSGLLGAGSNLIGGVGGSLYGGADQLLGGLLPNIGGVGISPAQGYLGNLFPNAVGQNPLFGGRAMQDAHINAFNAAKGNMAHVDAFNAYKSGGGGLYSGVDRILGGILPGGQPIEHGYLGKGLGVLNKVGNVAGTLNTVRNIFDPPGAAPGVYGDAVVPRPTGEAARPIILGGGQTPVNQSLNLTGQPTAMIAAPQVGAGVGMPGGYRDEISELVEDIIEGKENDDDSRQSDSLRGTYGGRTTSLA
jgi:hypothetical protein